MGKEKKLILIIALIIIVSSFICVVNYKMHFNGFFLNDAHDFGQMARNIYEGKGFKTSTLRPINIVHFQQLPHPEVTRPPLFPYMLAGLFTIFGANDFAVVLSGGIAYVALVVLTFLFGLEISKSHAVALFGAVMVALLPYLLSMSIMGTSDIVYAALFMGFLFFYLKKKELMFWHGMIIGALYLFRTNTIFFVIPWLIIEFGRKDIFSRKRDIIKFLSGAFSIILPYLARNYLETGSPFFSIHKYTLALETRTYPGYTLWTHTEDISAFRFLIDHPAEVIEKFINSLFSLASESVGVLRLSGVVVFLLAFIFPLGNEKAVKIRKLVFWTIIVQIIVISPMGSGGFRFYLYMLPAVFIFFGMGIDGFLRSSEKLKKVTSMALVIACILILYPSVSYWQSSKQPNIYIDMGKALKEMTKTGDVIASDIAWEISWYADRKTVWLPYDIETMDKISSSIPVDYVFLSVGILRPLATYRDDTWHRLFLEPGKFQVSGLGMVRTFYLGRYPIGVLYRVERNNKEQENR